MKVYNICQDGVPTFGNNNLLSSSVQLTAEEADYGVRFQKFVLKSGLNDPARPTTQPPVQEPITKCCRWRNRIMKTMLFNRQLVTQMMFFTISGQQNFVKEHIKPTINLKCVHGSKRSTYFQYSRVIIGNILE